MTRVAGGKLTGSRYRSIEGIDSVNQKLLLPTEAEATIGSVFLKH
jgi:hypothetical protein